MATIVATLPVYDGGSLAITMPMLGYIQGIKFADSSMNLFDRTETSFTAINGDTGLSFKVKGTGFTYDTGYSGTTYKMTGGTITEVEVIDSSLLSARLHDLRPQCDGRRSSFNGGWNLFVGDDQFWLDRRGHFVGWAAATCADWTATTPSGDRQRHPRRRRGKDRLYGGRTRTPSSSDGARQDPQRRHHRRLHRGRPDPPREGHLLQAGQGGKALTKAEFVVGSKATDKFDRIIYQKATGNLLYDPDGSKGRRRFSSPI